MARRPQPRCLGGVHRSGSCGARTRRRRHRGDQRRLVPVGLHPESRTTSGRPLPHARNATPGSGSSRSRSTMSTAMTSLRSRNFVNVLTDELLPHCSDAVRDRVLTQCHLDFRSGLPTCCVNSRPSATRSSSPKPPPNPTTGPPAVARSPPRHSPGQHHADLIPGCEKRFPSGSRPWWGVRACGRIDVVLRLVSPHVHDPGEGPLRHPPLLDAPLHGVFDEGGVEVRSVNWSRPTWKPIIALTRAPDSSCSARNSTQRAVSRVAWIRSNGEGSPPS